MSTFIKDVRDRIISTERPGKNFKDLSGTTFGVINVLSYEGYYHKKDGVKAFVYKCQCQRCGNIYYIPYNTIHSRNPAKCSRICKCKMIKSIGGKVTPEFHTYCAMKQVAKANNYAICDEWNDPDTGFDSFYDWLHDIGWNNNVRIHVIDRNKKIMSPDNVDIINNYDFIYKGEGYIVIKGYAFSVCEWAKMTNISKALISQRIIINGWDRKDAVLIPKRKFASDPVPKPWNVEDLVTPEWKEKNHYQFFKELGLIK